MNKPEVSVIIPVYNAEKYLRQCLESISCQSLENMEIICVDDGSVDSSAQILEEYALKDERFKVLAQENAGAGAARNKGLEAAKGEYLSFLDADDFFEPDMLEEAYKKACADDADFVVFDSDQYYTEEDVFKDVSWTIRYDELPEEMPFNHTQISGNVFKVFVGWAWDKLYKRSFIEEHGLKFQEQRTSNDFYFVFSALVLAEKISVSGKKLIHQRRDSADSLSKTRENSWFCFYDALMALKSRLEEEGLYKSLEKDFINYCVHACLWNINSLAEPTRSTLIKKLKSDWEKDLGIRGKHIWYFYNKGEYLRYKSIVK